MFILCLFLHDVDLYVLLVGFLYLSLSCTELGYSAYLKIDLPCIYTCLWPYFYAYNRGLGGMFISLAPPLPPS